MGTKNPSVHYFLRLEKGFHFQFHNNQSLSIEVEIIDLLPVSRYCKFQLTEENFENNNNNNNQVYGRRSLVYIEVVFYYRINYWEFLRKKLKPLQMFVS